MHVQVTSPANDGNLVADIELGITSVREVVQAKRHKKTIHRRVLDALRGFLHRYEAVRGTIITTSRFSKGSSKAAFERGAPPITLSDGERPIDLLIEHGIGVRMKGIEVLEVDADRVLEYRGGSRAVRHWSINRPVRTDTAHGGVRERVLDLNLAFVTKTVAWRTPVRTGLTWSRRPPWGA